MTTKTTIGYGSTGNLRNSMWKSLGPNPDRAIDFIFRPRKSFFARGSKASSTSRLGSVASKEAHDLESSLPREFLSSHDVILLFLSFVIQLVHLPLAELQDKTSLFMQRRQANRRFE
jgi:hypothetical protein